MDLKWEKIETTNLSYESLSSLLDNEIPFVEVGELLNEYQCAEIISYLENKDVIKKYDYNFEEHDAPEALHYMTTHYLFEENADSKNFLAEAENSNKQYQDIVANIEFDPLGIIDHKMAEAGYDIEIANEKGHNYSRTMIRSLKEGALLHADYAPLLKEDWSIKNIDSELAWNIYLSVPDSGGECVVYNRQWQIEDNSQIVSGSYGYDPIVIRDCEWAAHTPKAGSFVLFNSRNFHEVLPSSDETDRITMGGHFGRKIGFQDTLLSWI